MFLDPVSLRDRLETLEEIEKASLRMVTQAMVSFSAEGEPSLLPSETNLKTLQKTLPEKRWTLSAFQGYLLDYLGRWTTSGHVTCFIRVTPSGRPYSSTPKQRKARRTPPRSKSPKRPFEYDRSAPGGKWTYPACYRRSLLSR